MVQEAVAALHLADAVLQGLEGPLGLGYDRREEMGYVIVELEFDDLGVDEEELHLPGRAPVQDGEDDRIDADGLPRAGGAGYEEVGRLRKVDELRLARDVLAEYYGDLHLGRLEGLVLDYLAQGDDGPPLVGDLDPHRVLARNGRDDADARGREPQGDVVAEVRDLGQFDSGRGQDLEHGDDGTLADSGHFRLDLEFGQGLAKYLGRALGLLVHDPVLAVGVGGEDSLRGDKIGLVLAARGLQGKDALQGGRGRCFGGFVAARALSVRGRHRDELDAPLALELNQGLLAGLRHDAGLGRRRFRDIRDILDSHGFVVLLCGGGGPGELRRWEPFLEGAKQGDGRELGNAEIESLPPFLPHRSGGCRASLLAGLGNGGRGREETDGAARLPAAGSGGNGRYGPRRVDDEGGEGERKGETRQDQGG